MKKRKLLAVLLSALMVITMAPSIAFAGEDSGDFGTISLYINNVEQTPAYDSFKDAIAAANKVDSSQNVRLECEAGKLIPNGDGNHISVTRSMTINGNGAVQVLSKNEPNGEATFAIEAYEKFSADTTLEINKLKNATVWGTRNTKHKFTLKMTDCDTDSTYSTGQRVYINGATGENYIYIEDCDFNNSANKCTVYSNAAGKISISDCTFKGVNEPININTKATTGNVEISVVNTTFTDCGAGNAGDSKQWAAPVRVVNSGNISGGSQVIVNTCKFIYTGENSSANGDILLGDGRSDETSYDVNLDVKGTESEVMIQYPGYYDAKGNKDTSKMYVHNVADTEQSRFSVSVAEIDGVKYMSLAEAIEAADEGDTVVLTADINVETWNQIWDITGVTIDGNGKTIKVTGSIESLANHDAVLHSAGGNTFKDITFDLSGITASDAQGTRAINAAAGDTIENVKIIGGKSLDYGITCSGTDADNDTITIRDCIFENCGYGVYDSESGSVENVVINGSTFENCDYATIMRAENGEFTDNTVIAGKLNIMKPGQTVTGNMFTDKSRVKFYDTDATFKKNNMSADSYLDFDEDVTGQADVSANYWGGGEPSNDQLGGEENTANVTGTDVYYVKDTMAEEDLNTYEPPVTEPSEEEPAPGADDPSVDNEGTTGNDDPGTNDDMNNEKKPVDDVTPTGDDSNMMIPMAAAAAALAAMTVVVATRKRQSR